MESNMDMKLWVHLDQVNTLIRKARALELKQFKLSLSEAEVLHILNNKNKDLSLAEIALWNYRELNSVLIRVNKMEKKGYLKKLRSSDEKKIKISLTKEGKEIYSNASQESIRMIFEILSDEDKKHLETILQKVDQRTRELIGMGFKPPFLR